MQLLLILLALLNSIISQNYGNRTHLPSGSQRPSSSTSDPNYEISAKGVVRVGVSSDEALFSQTSKNLNLLSKWAADQNLTLKIVYLPSESSSQPDYMKRVLLECESNTPSFDLLIADTTLSSIASSCFQDLLGWNMSLLSDSILSSLYSPYITNASLYALPLHVHFKALFYNKVYLETHSYSLQDIPDIAALGRAMQDIIVNERGAENYLAQGFAAPLSETQEWVSLLQEWAAGADGVILQDAKRSLVTTGNVSLSLALIMTWWDASLVSSDLFTTDKATILRDFLDRHIVFLHMDIEEMARIQNDIEFDWDVMGMPGFNVPGYFMTLAGTMQGVLKNGSNPTGAVKLAAYLNSPAYMRTVVQETGYLHPLYPSLLKDARICASLTKYCQLYNTATPTARPSTIFGRLYPNASLSIQTSLSALFTGTSGLADTLMSLDTSIRSLLHLPASNATLTDDVVAARPKQKFKGLWDQILLLFLFIGCSVTGVVLFKRKTMWEEMQERRAIKENDSDDQVPLIVGGASMAVPIGRNDTRK